MKVSPDGSAWNDALIAERNTGLLSVQDLKSIPANYAAQVSSVIFTPGGDGTVSIYRINTTSG